VVEKWSGLPALNLEERMRRSLVTGANRGLGLEFTSQLLARGDRVLAACRRPDAAAELHALSTTHGERLQVRRVDMADPDSVSALAQETAAVFDGLDLLINNAGMNVRGERFGSVTGDGLTSSLRTNTIGPFLLAQALAPLIARARAAVVANISSQLGSIARTDSFYTPSYAISKAALNMASVLLAHGLGTGVCVVALHPGWVQTAMGGSGAPLTAKAAVDGMLRVIDALKPEHNGRFMDYQGKPMPW
jgi:NAD(P)-dependent dehydrogenase (short-subunit alcohol dehydrogenase family)